MEFTLVILVTLFFLVLFPYLGYKRPGIAIVISPLASAGLVFLGIEGSVTFVAAAGAVIFLATIIAIAGSGRGGDLEKWPHVVAKWTLVSLGVLIWLVVVAWSGFWGIYGFVLLLFLTGLIISFGLSSRHATAAYVISTIGASMRQNLPLTMALESAASGREDSRAGILRSISKWLVKGYCLSEAIKLGYPKCPGYAVAMIGAAEKIDQLPSAISSIEADMVVKADESRKIRPFHPLYPVVLITLMFIVVLGLMTFVVPQFSSILTEVLEGGSFPASTAFLLDVASFVAYDMGWLVLAVAAFIVLVGIVFSIGIRFRPRRPDKPFFVSRIGDFIKWHLPVLHWFEKNYSTVQTVELLRLSLNAGCTVNKGIANTLGLDVNNRFKKRLGKWLVKVEAGDNIAKAARESKLGSSLAWAFDDTVNRGNTLAILETLEAFHRSEYGYRVNMARYMFWPCVTITMGAMVGFVAYAIYSPMVLIISGLASAVTP